MNKKVFLAAVVFLTSWGMQAQPRHPGAHPQAHPQARPQREFTIQNVSNRVLAIHMPGNHVRNLRPRESMSVPESVFRSGQVQSLLDQRMLRAH